MCVVVVALGVFGKNKMAADAGAKIMLRVALTAGVEPTIFNAAAAGASRL